MKSKLFIGLVTVGLLAPTTSVCAMGNATVSFESKDAINVGDIFTVKMNINNISNTYDGVVSLGGNLSFDENTIEYISSKGIETPYLFQINEKSNYKIAGLDFTLDNGIKNNLTVYEFTFKALKEGNTTITFVNPKLTDSKDYITTNVIDHEINIKNNEEINDKVVQSVTKSNYQQKNKTKIEKKNNNKEINKTNNNEKEFVQRITKNLTNLFTKLIKFIR